MESVGAWLKERRFSSINLRKLLLTLCVAGVACYYVAIPVLVVVYKLMRVPSLLPVVDVGMDSWIPKKAPELIPAILHGLTPETSHGVPLEWETSYDSCHGIHSRYQDTYSWKLYTDWDMRYFIEKHYGWFLDTYDSYPFNIQRVDAARYFIIRHFGGIYLDLDVGCRRSLDNLRRSGVDMIVPDTDPLGVSNDFFMAKADHPFMIYVTQRLVGSASACSWSSYLSVMFSTGPGFFSLALYDYLSDTATGATGGSIGLMSNVDYTSNVLFHLDGSSWIQGDGKFFMYVFNHLTGIILLIIAVLLALYLRGKQLAMQRGMKNVDGFIDFAGIMIRLGLDEVKTVGGGVKTRAREAKSRIFDGYTRSKESVAGFLRRGDDSGSGKRSRRRDKDSRDKDRERERAARKSRSSSRVTPRSKGRGRRSSRDWHKEEEEEEEDSAADTWQEHV
jgi:inositol phosphorylceramide mannosyltransferase catalytic subunit